MASKSSWTYRWDNMVRSLCPMRRATVYKSTPWYVRRVALVCLSSCVVSMGMSGYISHRSCIYFLNTLWYQFFGEYPLPLGEQNIKSVAISCILLAAMYLGSKAILVVNSFDIGTARRLCEFFNPSCISSHPPVFEFLHSISPFSICRQFCFQSKSFQVRPNNSLREIAVSSKTIIASPLSWHRAKL